MAAFLQIFSIGVEHLPEIRLSGMKSAGHEISRKSARRQMEVNQAEKSSSDRKSR